MVPESFITRGTWDRRLEGSRSKRMDLENIENGKRKNVHVQLTSKSSPDLSDSKQITYTHFHFGPFLFHTLIKPEECIKHFLKKERNVEKNQMIHRHRTRWSCIRRISDNKQRKNLLNELQNILKLGRYWPIINGRGRLEGCLINFSLDAIMRLTI